MKKIFVVLILFTSLTRIAAANNLKIIQFETNKSGLITTLEYLIEKKHPIAMNFPSQDINSAIEYCNKNGVLNSIITPLFMNFRDHINRADDIKALINLKLIGHVIPMLDTVFKRELGIKKDFHLENRGRLFLNESLIQKVKLDKYLAFEFKQLTPDSNIQIEHYNSFSKIIEIGEGENGLELTNSIFGIKYKKKNQHEINEFKKSLMRGISIYAHGGVAVNPDDVMDPHCDVGCGIIKDSVSLWAEDLVDRKQIEKEKNDTAERAEKQARIAEEQQRKAEEAAEKQERNGPISAAIMQMQNDEIKKAREEAEIQRKEAEKARLEAEDAKVELFDNLNKDKKIAFDPYFESEDGAIFPELFPGILNWEFELLKEIKVSNDRDFEQELNSNVLTQEERSELELEQIIKTPFNDEFENENETHGESMPEEVRQNIFPERPKDDPK